jgi:hypothetical protein
MIKPNKSLTALSMSDVKTTIEITLPRRLNHLTPTQLGIHAAKYDCRLVSWRMSKVIAPGQHFVQYAGSQDALHVLMQDFRTAAELDQ